MNKILAVINNKGGVGKTTFTIRISQELSQRGKKTLVIDADPQGNTTYAMLKTRPELDINYKYTLYDVMENLDFDTNKTLYNIDQNLYLLPSSIELQQTADSLLLKSGTMVVQTVLKRQINKIKDQFDYIVIDAGPTLNSITSNILTAATDVIVPIEAADFSYIGIQMLMNRINDIKLELNLDLRKPTIVMNKYNATRKLDKDLFINSLEKIEGFSQVSIPERQDIRNAQTEGIELFDFKSKASKEVLCAFKELVNEVIKDE